MQYSLVGFNQYEEDIKRSRFLALAAPIDTAEHAMAFFAQHGVPEATHNCWAYKIGQEYRFNDDGEPGGTAGRPILQAIEGQQCDNVAVLVIRWFGGVKLGTGGLMRAYGGVAAQCLRLADKSPIIEKSSFQCHIPYADMDLLRSRFDAYAAHVSHEEFDGEGVMWTLLYPIEHEAALRELCINLSSGQARFIDEE